MEINLTTRPALKRSYNASLTLDGKLLLGVTPDDCVEVEIHQPWASAFMCLLDGGKSVLDIVSALKQRGFDVSTNDVLEQLRILDAVGTIEESNEYAQAVRQSILTEHESIRYDRQMLLFQTVLGSYQLAFEAQHKLKKSRVALVGLGGVGSYAFYGLAAMGVGFLRVVEFDKVELTNLSRQILYEDRDIGKSKIEVAKKRGPRINPNCQFEFVETMVSNLDTCVQVLEGVDLAIIAADIPRGKIWPMFNEAAHVTGTPVLYGGSAQTWVVCGPLVIPNKTPCYECCGPEALRGDHPVVEFVRSRYTTALIDPYNATGASLFVLEAVKYLTAFQPCQIIGRTVLMNLGTYESYQVPGQTRDNCNFCGKNLTTT